MNDNENGRPVSGESQSEIPLGQAGQASPTGPFPGMAAAPAEGLTSATGRTAGTQSGPAPKADGLPQGWEREVLEKIALAGVVEQRRGRRWSIFFRFLYVGLAALFLVIGSGLWDPVGSPVHTGKHTALVEVRGVIAPEGNASAELVIEALRAAFEDQSTAGIVMRINSPGGSPVQAGIIHDEMLRLRMKHPDKPLHAVIEDVCASGGYYVAAAAEQIFVDKASLVGSIGVLMEGFGFVGTMEKLGVERRLLTAGDNKGFLDSFSPLSQKQRDLAQRMLNEVHQQFIDVVRKGRAGRLKESPETFSGLVWTGERAIEMGLADGLNTLDGVARDVIKADRIIDFSRRENLAERLAKRLGASAGEAIARYGFSTEGTLRIR